MEKLFKVRSLPCIPFLILYVNLKQLHQSALPDAVVGDESLSFMALQECCKGKTYLVCLDDVWSCEVERQLNFLDESTASKLLVSTRIRNLIGDATEVQLALLSSTEAIAMLCSMSGISMTSDVPAEVVEIVQV
jgi:hypothetical protein